MRSFRAILAVLLALLWFPMTNSCLFASAFPGKFPSACECEKEAKQCDERGQPVSKSCDTCIPCVTLESGVNLAALTPLVAPQPMFNEVTQFMEKLRTLAQMEVATLPEPTPILPPISPPVWRDEVTKALPVRGPSFVA